MAKAGPARSKTKARASAKAPKAAPAVEPLAARAAAEESERALGQTVARALPIVTVFGAIVVGFTTSLGPALLVLASGVLLGAIALLWASVRTLGGDAPLPRDLEAIAAMGHGVDDLAERKLRVLRALKDLEHEHAVGKIDDADFAELSATYRSDAKDVMREMDADLAPMRERAEELARAYLAKRGIASDEARPEETSAESHEDRNDEASHEDRDDEASHEDRDDARVACVKCATSNEPDAAFCKKCGAPLRAAAGAEEKEPDAAT